MAVEYSFDLSGLEGAIERHKEATIQSLAYAGEKGVSVAREDHPNNWNDITGNLRSSIGYAIFVDGEPIEGLNNQYKQIAGGEGDGRIGLERAQAMVASGMNATKNNRIELVVCAGMEYAEAVEYGHITSKGNQTTPRDVLTSAKITATDVANQLLQK